MSFIHISPELSTVVPIFMAKIRKIVYQTDHEKNLKMSSNIYKVHEGSLRNREFKVRVGRIELPSRPWQGRVLPLNHTRNV